MWYYFFYTSVSGSASCRTDGKCHLTFNWWGNRPDTSLKPQYNVLSTDYDNFTIVYACKDTSSGSKEESVWILTRTPTIDAEKLKEY